MATTHDKLFPLFLTTDLPACWRFYVQSLGWTEVVHNDHYLQVRKGEDGAELCFMTPDAVPQMRLEPFPGQGVMVSVSTPNADAWLAALRERGVQPLNEPSDKPWGWRSVRAAKSALDKVEAALPPKTRGEVEQTALFALGLNLEPATRAMLRPIRAAIGGRKKLRFGYRDATEAITSRTVRPLGIYFWGSTWTLAPWSDMRTDYRNFRVDRITELHVENERFEHESPVTLEDFVAVMSST